MVVDTGDVPRDVAGMVVVTEGVTMLWVVADMDVSVGTVTEFVTTLKVVSVFWVVGEDGMLIVVVAEVLDIASVELRSRVELNEAVVLVDVDSLVGGVGVGVSVLTEDGGTVGDVCTVVETGRDAVDADVAVLVVE